MSVQDYPENLNPFKPRRHSFTRSFRKVIRSFIGKDNQSSKQNQRQTGISNARHTVQNVVPLPAPRNQSYDPTALPRSRFKERLEMTESLKRSSKDRTWYNEEKNPFAQVTEKKEIPTPPVRKSKGKKKRAPLPPRTTGDGQFLDVPSRTGSKWSLTSYETDSSSICYSEYDEIEASKAEENNEEILEMARKITEFADDSNKNLDVASEVKINVSSADSNSSQAKETDKDEETSESKVEDTNIGLEDDKKDVNEETEPDVQNEKDEEKPKMDSISISNGGVPSETHTNHHNQNELVRVRIIDNQEVVLRHPEDVEEDIPAERYTLKQKIQRFESFRAASPPPKVRQTVLTKENLLGQD